MISNQPFVSNQIVTSLYNNSSVGILFFDKESKLLAMNPVSEKLLDIDAMDDIQLNHMNSICQFCRGFTSIDEQQTCMKCYLKEPNYDFSSFQIYLQTKNDGVLPFSASYSLIDEENGISALIILDLTKQYKTREVLYEKKRMKNIIKAQEDERKRISRDLHDGVAQELLSTLVDMRLLKYMDLDENVRNKVTQTEKTLSRILDDIRNISVELRPASLDDLGLEAAFRSHCKWVEKNYGILVTFSSQLSGVRYSTEIETVVYRVCQEAILNATKYADVDVIEVRLYERDKQVHLIVKDEGTGFNVNDIDIKGTGLGLYGMRERAELVHGMLTIESTMDVGTTIHLRIPLLLSSGQEGEE